MSFPQTSANLAVQYGQEYWRLKTILSSPGDIYESPQSGRAFVIGPDSDIARVKIVYYDRQNPNLANEVIVSVDKPFIGRLDALGSETYQTGDGARLLISPADISPPFSDIAWRPYITGGSSGVSAPAISVVQPQLDLIQYLNEEPGFIAPRADRVYHFGQLPVSGGEPEQWFLVPFYGRRFVDVCVKTLGITPIGAIPVPPCDVDVFGINMSWIIPDSVNEDTGQQVELLGGFHLNAPTIGAGVSDSVAITNRAFDYLGVRITVDPLGPSSGQWPTERVVNTRIVMSDKI